MIDRFDKFGGIPRYVLDQDQRWDQELDVAISQCDLRLIEDSACAKDLQQTVSHKLLQYDVTSPSGSPIVRFASPYVEKEVGEQMLRKEKSALYGFINDSRELPSLSSIRGTLFKVVAHHLLCQGGKFSFRRLSDGFVSTLGSRRSFSSPPPSLSHFM